MRRISILFCAAAIAAVACNKAELEQPQVEESVLRPMTFTATTSDTRTSLDENGASINWSTEDIISVFDGQGNRPFSSTGSGRTVTFNGNADPDAANYYALYPFNGEATISGTTVTTTLPANQDPEVGTFADGLNISAAKTTGGSTEFHFSNVMSVAKFTIDSDALDGKTIKTVKFSSSHPLAGDVLINYGETITASAGTNTVNEITLTKTDGFGEGTYYFVVLPNEGGPITMTFESTDGSTASKSATLGKSFTAGVIKNLGTVGGLEWETPQTEKIYTKVTSNDDLVSGQYLIVYEEGSVAFNGGLTNLDVASNTIEVVLNNGTIASTPATDAASFTITISGTNNSESTILSNSGYYIGRTSDSNGMNTSQTDAYKNTISIDQDGNADIISAGKPYLRYNSSSGDERFRYYKSTTYTIQKAIALYALETSARIPAELSFASSTAEAIVGQTGFTGPQLTKNPANIPVTWSSSNQNVAHIDPTSGAIYLNNAGTTKITASFAGDSEYAPASAFYTLTVKPAYTITLQNVTDGKVFVGAASSSSVKFKVTSSYAWESSVSFMSGFSNSFEVTPTQNDAGEVEVTVNCTVDNQSEEDRQLGTITISNDGDEKTIQVWQLAYSDEPTTYTMTISSSQVPANSTCDVVWYREANTTLTHNGISWDASVEGTLNFVGANAYCTIGTKSEPAAKITLSTTGFAGKTIMAARLKGHCSSNTGPVLSITAGSTIMLDSEPLIKTTSTVYESTNGNVVLTTGDALTFEITSNAQAGITIYYIEVDYR